MQELCASQPRFFRPDAPVVVRHAASPGLDVNPIVTEVTGAVTDAFQDHAVQFLWWDVDTFDPPERPPAHIERGLSVMYFLLQAYRVRQPTCPWLLWIQAHLPGMPDATNLVAEAKTANQAVKDSVEKQVRLVIEASISSVKD